MSDQALIKRREDDPRCAVVTHPAGMIRLLQALAKRQEMGVVPRTWWERFKDMWMTL